VDEAKHDSFENENGAKPNEHNEVLVVSLSDASSKLRAVVIEAFDTTVANSTMDGSWRPVDVASLAVFNFC